MVTHNRSETPIAVYLVVANRLVRESFVRVFRKRAGLMVAGENQDCAAAVRELADKPCDVLLLSSVGMLRTITERANGAESTAGPKPLLFGMEENPDSFLEAVRLGACGYLLNDASSSEVVAAIRAVARGEAVCPLRLCKRLFEHVSRNASPGDAGLTCRQRQLMQLVAKGMTNKEIATNLKVSEYTVKNHLSRIMAQLRAENRHQAVDVMRAGGYSLSA